MNLYLEGHDFRYAVEQCQLVFFPDDRPVFTDAPPSPPAEYAHSKLSFTEDRAVAVTVLLYKGTCCRGVAYVSRRGYPDKLACDRELSYAVKLSFYRAACRATGYQPPWGALTGIRPAGMLRSLSRRGLTLSQADRALAAKFDVSAPRRALCRSAAEAARRVEESLSPNDISIYIGIPFCPTRCAYCTFVSHAVDKAGHLLPDFLDALNREIEAVGALVKEMCLRPIALYIGGGTPTVLSASQLDILMLKLFSHINLTDLRECTVEAGRPDTITREKLSVLKQHGVTRVSVNPQSLQDIVLDAAGRPHTSADTLTAYTLTREVGFHINMDLIAGLPSDTAGGFAESLSRVVELCPDNITIHTLARKKGSTLTNRQLLPAPPDTVGNMLTHAYSLLRETDYHCYYLYRQKFMAGPFENTGWSRPGRENLYNVCMMEELHTVLSLGGGGVSKLIDPSRGRVERVFNPKYPYEYLSHFDGILKGKKKIRAFFMQRGDL